MAEPSTERALEGVKVLDLTQYEAGPTITEALAWLGAEVLKVEPPQTGEQGRYGATDIPGVDAFHFILLNCSKKSISVNLRSEQGKELLRKLIARVDVFVENFAPGTIDRMGFSYEQVSAINPRIIYAQVKGFPSDSPFSRYLAFDQTMQAMGGAMSITGTSETPPIRGGANLGDTGGGMHCLTGILAALYQRHFTGLGQRVEISMQEVVMNFCRAAFYHQYADGSAAPRVGNLDPLGRVVPSDVYRCQPFGSNDYCYIACESEEQWQRLLEVVGRPDLAKDARFNTPAARSEHLEEVNGFIGQWAGKHTKHEAMRILREAGATGAATLDTGELFDDRYLRQRGTIAAVQHPVRGEVLTPGWPVKLSESPTEVVRAPLLGEHNQEIYGGWLGLSDQELGQLQADGAI